MSVFSKYNITYSDVADKSLTDVKTMQKYRNIYIISADVSPRLFKVMVPVRVQGTPELPGQLGRI